MLMKANFVSLTSQACIAAPSFFASSAVPEAENPVPWKINYIIWDTYQRNKLVLTLKAPRKILEQMTIYFCFLFFRRNHAWHYMWIVCPAEDSHVMSSIISSENYVEHALKMSSASRDGRFKG